MRGRQDISGQPDAKIDETRPGEELGIDAIGIRPRGGQEGQLDQQLLMRPVGMEMEGRLS